MCYACAAITSTSALHPLPRPFIDPLQTPRSHRQGLPCFWERFNTYLRIAFIISIIIIFNTDPHTAFCFGFGSFHSLCTWPVTLLPEHWANSSPPKTRPKHRAEQASPVPCHRTTAFYHMCLQTSCWMFDPEKKKKNHFGAYTVSLLHSIQQQGKANNNLHTLNERKSFAVTLVWKRFTRLSQ